MKGHMYSTLFLILFPLVIALLLLFVRNDVARRFLVKTACVILSVASLALLTLKFKGDVFYITAHFPLADKLILIGDFLLAIYIFYRGIRAKRPLTCILIALQALALGWFELSYGHGITSAHNLFIDKLSILMALIIGIIGTLIAVYALGYMKDFHDEHHKELPDKRPIFFFVIFIFLSAMFGIVFANNLLWLYFFWEVTTLCSFILIGYKETEESKNNAFRALEFNLVGGLAFALGIIYLYTRFHTIELSAILTLGSVAIIPVIFLSFAGLTKSAQLPFSRWLLGAMVAPTPVSALLHSSTMVKAGVYIILRFASVLQGTIAGFVLALIGGITFLAGSFIAISQSDAKKVLAYSTIANLGLIVLCAGIGTYEAVWAGILLVLFHAVAKALLFLCVGAVEHKIHSRNIESMDGLIVSLPKISIMMQIGMAGMFLAPFGMLISKWAVLRALVDYNPVLAIFVVFGSAATLFFWVKWMGKLVTVIRPLEDMEHDVPRSVWVTLGLLSIFTVGLCGLFPVVSSFLIEPYCLEIYGRSSIMSPGNIVIMSSMLAMVMLFPLSFLLFGKRVKVVDAYLGGANTHSNTEFRDSLGKVKNMELRGYYLEQFFGEHRLLKYGIMISLILTVLMFLASWL